MIVWVHNNSAVDLDFDLEKELDIEVYDKDKDLIQGPAASISNLDTEKWGHPPKRLSAARHEAAR